MNTPMKVMALPPVQLSAFPSGAPRPQHDGLIRRADRERYGLEPWREPADNKVVIKPKPKPSPAEANLEQARTTLRDMKSESARRTLTRVSAKLKARKFPAGEREAAEALYRIIGRR